MRRVVLACAIVWAGSSGAAETERLTLRAGQPIDFTPGFLPAQVICDDVTIIQVEDGAHAFRLTGLKVGVTLCGFVSTVNRARRRVIEMHVVKD